MSSEPRIEPLTEAECDDIFDLTDDEPFARVEAMTPEELSALFNDPDRPFDQEINQEVIPL
jgi:hypothetical protein